MSDWQIRGPLLWEQLHIWALTADLATAPAWLSAFDAKIGCDPCRTDWRGWIQEHPPDLSSGHEFFAWTVSAHNAVNRRLGKPELSIETAIKEWEGRSINKALMRMLEDTRPAKELAFTRARMTGETTNGLEVNCQFSGGSARRNTVTCAKGLFGGTPHVAMCAGCTQRQPLNPESPAYLRVEPVGESGDTLVHRVNSTPFNSVVTVLASSAASEKLVLQSRLSPGDVLMLTAAVRDLHRAHPGRFVTAVETTAPELWEFNPLITTHDASAGPWRTIEMHYPLINQCNQRPVHFIQGYAEYLSSQLKLPIPISEFKADIYLSEEEKGWQNQVDEKFGYRGPFWIMMAGGKYDFTCKWWPPAYYQRVVDHFLGRLQFVQCGQADHWHPPLRGVFNLIGQTSIRQFVRLMYHAEGVICPVTFAMHLAAATPCKQARLRPCVVVAGGREPPHWEAYPGHQFLHTIGSLPCCATGGCWRNRCQPVGDGDAKDNVGLCERPVFVEQNLRIPQCMTMVRPEHVIGAIERVLA
jgi:ADP-heptose:LPS heptosyltransferase